MPEDLRLLKRLNQQQKGVFGTAATRAIVSTACQRE